MQQPCILCEQPRADFLCRAGSFDYLTCTNCDLIFVRPEQRLSPEKEKQRYDLHENDPADPGYRKFLNQLFIPMQQKIDPGSSGLDFGSGPGPTLHLMFEEKGHSMNIYDPFYADDPSVLRQNYDFITTTETAEHLYHPAKEFKTLWNCLKPNGYLGIMTMFVPSKQEFPDWHYRKDDTHVTFYSEKTFRWLAKQWKADVCFPGDRTVIFQKTNSSYLWNP